MQSDCLADKGLSKSACGAAQRAQPVTEIAPLLIKDGSQWVGGVVHDSSESGQCSLLCHLLHKVQLETYHRTRFPDELVQPL